MTYKYLIIILFMCSFMFMGFLCCREKMVEEKRLTDIQKAQNPFFTIPPITALLKLIFQMDPRGS
jgi:hypothetical protein